MNELIKKSPEVVRVGSQHAREALNFKISSNQIWQLVHN